jgi:hypothetical protein
MQLTTCRYTLSVNFKPAWYKVDRHNNEKALRISIDKEQGFLYLKEDNPEAFIKQIHQHGQRAIPKRLRREIETRWYQKQVKSQC